MELTGSYNWLLVIVSVMAAIGASFVALSTVPRIYASHSGKRPLIWIIIYGLSLGAGIWTMHFIAILALQLPIPVQYDISITIASLLLAIVASALAISPLRGGGTLRAFAPRTLLTGTGMGLAIAGMHYSGMAAMRLNASMHHEHEIVILAIVIAIVASTVALAIANGLRDTRIFSQLQKKFAAAIIMGMAVSAMHYTAMEGTHFHLIETMKVFDAAIDPLILAIFILVVAFLIQGSIIISALFDEAYSFSKQTATTMKRRADMNKVLSEILELALKKLSLKETLQEVLELLLSIEWLTLEDKGCIYLADEKALHLNIIAEKNLAKEIIEQCGTVEFGKCLCGTAAKNRDLIFKPGLDEDHSIRTEGMSEHGHFCIPVTSSSDLLGLINLYVNPDHVYAEEERKFLEAIADAVANIILSKQLESKANKIFTAIDQAGEAVLITDDDGIIEYVNKAFCKLTGFEEECALGKKPSILKSGNQDTSFYKSMWDTIKAGKIWQGEIIEKRKNGTFYPAMLTISPIRGSNGEITHFVGIHEDLSSHKELEVQFRQAQKMEALGTLVGGIAHDFNNMLAGMIGTLFIIKKQVIEMPDIVEKIERIEQVGFEAAEMIKQMMLFARNEEVDTQQISLCAFFKEVFRLHQIAIPENITFDRQLSDEEIFVLGNPTQLQQLLLNLFNNAVDALKGAKEPRISFKVAPFIPDQKFIASHHEANATAYAHLSLVDNGEGIATQHIDRIFDPFYTTKKAGKGTGLGLSGVASIVKAHNGFIDVESEVERGTTFDIYLPMTQNRQQRKRSNSKESTPIQQGRESIMIVDDNATLRQTTAETLESLGYSTLQAGNGKEAVERYKSEQADLILMDIVMPEMEGPEAAKIILSLDPDAKIIFATGYDLSDSLQNFEGLESFPVLTKPFEISELSHTIRLLLK